LSSPYPVLRKGLQVKANVANLSEIIFRLNSN